MGLLGKFASKESAKQPSDDVLLLHAIFCMAAADGHIEETEDEVIRSYANTLPEFRHMDGDAFQRAIDQTVAIAQQHERDMKRSLAVLATIQSEAVRRKAFVLAVDIAMSSGDIDAAEEDMLEAMQRILGIADDLAERIVEVIALKYVT